jgi:Flp pilus assembly pilin Flp
LLFLGFQAFSRQKGYKEFSGGFRRMPNLFDEDRGSAVVEYGLGLALIGLIVVVFLKGLGVALNNIFI